jgi:hypothetical protein
MARENASLCPSCGKPVAADTSVCACGMILRLDLLRHEAPADPLPGAEAPAADREFHGQLTGRFDPVQSMSEINLGSATPQPVPDADIFAMDLAPLELYVLSKIDGRRGGRELIKVTGLRQVELSVVLMKLLRAGGISMQKASLAEAAADSGEWHLPTPGERMSKRAKDEVALYREHKKRGGVTTASLHLKKAVAYEASPALVRELERHYETAVSRCDGFYKEARRLLTQGRGDEVKAVLTKATLEFPGEAGFWNLLAVWAVTHAHDKRAARDYLGRAVQLDPDNEAYRTNLAKL